MPDLVAIDLPGGPEFVDVLVRAWDRGDAVLPLDQRLSADARQRVVESLRPAVVVDASGEHRRSGGTGEGSRPGARREPVGPVEPVEPGDALVVSTSGTTGAPKGVVLTMAAVEASAIATTSRLGVDPGRNRWLACLPLNHVGGLSVLTRSLLTGTPCTVMPGFDAAAVKGCAGPDVFVSLVATALGRVSADAFHTIVVGGSAPPANLPPNVVTTYGMTETGSGVVYDGIPLDGVEVSVDVETSEIRVRCPMLLRCYRDGSVPLDADGWFRTGDRGWLDSEGRLHVEGRMSDLIITGGENVWPGPVEEAIRTHRGVEDVAVVGVADPEWGQRVVAWVVPVDRSAATGPGMVAELRALVGEKIAPYAAPKEVLFVKSFPRTAIGKVRRDLLVGQYDSDHTAR